MYPGYFTYLVLHASSKYIYIFTLYTFSDFSEKPASSVLLHWRQCEAGLEENTAQLQPSMKMLVKKPLLAGVE